MSRYLSGAGASFHAAGTWYTTDAAAGAAQLAAAGSAVPGTSGGNGTDSAPWTGDASVIAAIAIAIASRAGSPSGTLRAAIYQTSGTPAEIAGVTIDLADLPAIETWAQFLFASPVTLEVGHTYVVRLTRSGGASSVAVRTEVGGSTNWTRILRTSSHPGAGPTSGDETWICGELTGQGTSTPISVAVDQDSSLIFGQVLVGAGGTLAYATGSAAAYKLRLAGDLQVLGGGTLTLGTVAAPIPSDTTAILEFVCARPGDYGLEVLGALTGRGAPRTYDRARLASPAAIEDTDLTLDASVDWAAGDKVAIAATNRPDGIAALQTERREIVTVLDAVATIGALEWAHVAGAELILLTRNAEIRGATLAAPSWVHLGPASVVDLAWVEIHNIGAPAPGQRGLEVDTAASGSLALDHVSIHDAKDHGLFAGSAAWDNVTITDLVACDLAQRTGPGVYLAATSGTTWSITDAWVFSTSLEADAVVIEDLGGTFDGLLVVGGRRGAQLSDSAAPAALTLGDVLVRSSVDDGLTLQGVADLTAGDLEGDRCGGRGVVLEGPIVDLAIASIVAAGNGVAGVAAEGASSGVAISVIALDGETVTPYGIDFSGALAQGWTIASGTFADHGTADINCGNGSTEPLVQLAMTGFGTPTVEGDEYLSAESEILVN